jgi:hypothetical protein
MGLLKIAVSAYGNTCSESQAAKASASRTVASLKPRKDRICARWDLIARPFQSYSA